MRNCLLLMIFASALARAEISVTDFLGRTVTLEQPAQRIVALAPHIVENLYTAGAGEQLVGVVSYSNFPEAATRLPIVGSYKSFSLESILALEPDLIIMWASGNGAQRLQQLEQLGIPVYASEPRLLADIGRSIRDYEALIGRAAGETSQADSIDQQIERLRQQYGSRTRLGVFYQVWHEPLQTLNGEHLISDVIRLCGGRNVFADATTLAPRLSLESVLERDPQVIVASGMGQARPDWLDDWLAYPFLQAVENNALYFVHPDHLQRPTARILLGATALCRQLDQQRPFQGVR